MSTPTTNRSGISTMSSTPRTDAVEDWSSKFQGCKVVPNWKSQALERELNAANERIKRLEEAGDWVAAWICDHKHLIDDINKPLKKWTKAKEAKP